MASSRSDREARLGRPIRPSEEHLEARRLLAHGDLTRSFTLASLADSPSDHASQSRLVADPATQAARARVHAESQAQATSSKMGPAVVSLTVPGLPGQLVPVAFHYLQRRATYRNELAIYRVDDATGRIGTLKPGDHGYTSAALKSPDLRLVFSRRQGPGEVVNLLLPGGSSYGFLFVQNSTLDRLLKKNPQVSPKFHPLAFTSFSRANVDHFGHVKPGDSGRYAFEDQTGGGDHDFNDLILRVGFGQPFGVPTSPGSGTVGSNPGGLPTSGTGTLSVTIDQPSPGLLTNRVPVVTGHVSGSAEALATLRVQLDSGPAVPLAFDTTTGAFSDPLPLAADGSADGPHAVSVRAVDPAGDDSGPAATSFLLDTQPPTVTLGSPTPGLVTDANVTMAGVVADATSGVASLVARVDNGASAPVTFDASGAFRFATNLATDGSANGPHVVHLVATDRAGNASGSTDFPFTLMAAHGLLNGLNGVTITQVGGSPSGTGGGSANGFDVILREGDSFEVALKKTITVPAQASVLTFSYTNLNFDTPDPSGIQDAFEAALVDASGRPLVHTIATSRDAFFNITEGQPAVSAAGTTVRGRDVTVDLAGLVPGTQATLILRLVNNDGATKTTVELTRIALLSGGSVTPVLAASASLATAASRPVDTSTLSDISASSLGVYGRTSFDEGSKVLHADLAIRDVGRYSAWAPLVVGVDQISDPRVRLLNFDGRTAIGVPYLNYSDRVAAGGFAPGSLTGTRTLDFYDPGQTPFTYHLVVLGQLDIPPAFTSTPRTEAVPGFTYIYPPTTTDPLGLPLTFSLPVGPAGMTVDPRTGRLTWTPTAADLGSQAVDVRVDDGHGGTADQKFTITTADAPPNRPPVFISVPVVDANVLTPYRYQAIATDPDYGQVVTYSIAAGPSGMTIDPASGLVTWTPTAAEAGPNHVTLRASDGHGGQATQSFLVDAMALAGTHPPRIISQPVTTLNLAVTSTYRYPVRALEPDAGVTLAYSLAVAPKGLAIDSRTGEISGLPVGASAGASYPITVRVEDGRGGSDAQSYNLGITNAAPGGIQGTVFDDLNANGTRDSAVPTTVGLSVAGTGNPFLAGQPDGTSSGGDLAPAQSPTLVAGYPLLAGSAISFTVTGNVNSGPGVGPGPDGGAFVHHLTGPENGISDLYAPVDALVGVFLGPNQPTGTAPGTLDFRPGGNIPGGAGTSYASLSPLLRQVFFIGDGRTATGALQGITVPAGATRLYLGVMQAGHWSADVGTYQVQVAPYQQPPNTLKLTAVSTPFNNPISVDYYEPHNSVVVSDFYGGGSPHNFDEILADGTQRTFSTVSGFTDEVYIATVRSGDPAGFVPGDLFVGNGRDGQIARITDGGQMVINPWSVLPGPNHGLFRGALYFDRAGDFGGDLIVATDHGEFWRINAAGVPTMIARVNQFIEGITTLPNDVARYGPLAGKIVAGAELNGGVWTVAPSGATQFFALPNVPGPESLNFIPANQNFFGVNFGTGQILGAPASAFRSMVGDILLAAEFGGGTPGLFDLHWDGQAVVATALKLTADSPPTGSWEGSAFSPAGISGVDAVPVEPGLSRFTVYLDLNHDGRLDLGEPSTTTDDSGRYSFANVSPGTYDVAVVGMPGYRQTLPASGPEVVEVASGRIASGVDFGLTQLAVDAGPRSPGFTSTPPHSATVNRLYRYNIAISNPDGLSIAFDLPAGPAGMAIDPVTGTLIWVPTADQIGTQSIVVRVTDARGKVALQSFQVVVTRFAQPPVITSTPPGPPVAGVPYRYRAQAQDAEGEPITFGLSSPPAGMTIDPGTGLVSWTPSTAQIGPNRVIVTASTPSGGESIQDFTLTVVAASSSPAIPPRILSVPGKSVRIGESYTYPVVASEPDGAALTFSLVAGPSGMTIDANGLVTWNPTATQFGSHPATIRVSNARGLSTDQSFDVEVVSQGSPLPPSITSSPGRSATVGRVYAYNPSAVDPGGGPLLWNLVTAPGGMSINPVSGAIRWSPTADQLGPASVVVRALNAGMVATSQAFTITVRSVNVPPMITSEPPTRAARGVAYSYPVVASDLQGDPLNYSLATAPAGMTIDAKTGLIRWTPDDSQVGTRSVSIRVDDGSGNEATQDYQVVVSAQPLALPPTITSAPPLGATSGRAYSYRVAATDPQGGAIAYSLLQAPAGMTIDRTSGVVSWVPTAAEIGLQFVTIAAVDPVGLGGTQHYAIVVKAEVPPVITSSPVVSIVAGLPYQYDLQVANPDGGPLTFSVDSGPAGLTVDPSGRVTWSPGVGDLGSHHVVLAVANAQGTRATQVYDLGVVADTIAPQVVVFASAGRVDRGSDVTIHVSATDNVAVKAIKLTVGGVPQAIDSNGNAIVTLASAGTVDAVATAVDPAGNVGRASTTVQVIDPSITSGPTVTIASPTPDALLTSLTNIVGTVASPGLSFYRVEYAPADQVDLNNPAGSTAAFTTIARGTRAVANGTLASFDPTSLMNNQYVIRVVAQDVNGNVATQSVVVNVSGNLKFGEFTRSFIDLTVPVAGIPITVARTYDTRNASRSGDFGYGWTLSTLDPHIFKAVPANPNGDLFSASTFKLGTRVYITSPSGRREGFTFNPYAQSALFFGTFWHPRFDPDPGVTDTLSVDDTVIQRFGNEFRGFLFGFAYNPDEFTLTVKDGTSYRFSDLTGLEKVTNPTGATLSITTDGITSSTGQSVKFLRDAQGRIGEVDDPEGHAIRYAYDAIGNLASVTDRIGQTTTNSYLSTPAHYLSTVTDPLGHPVYAVHYDAFGRVQSITDASGQSTTSSFDPNLLVESSTDVLGNPTTDTYDVNGNILAIKDALGQTTHFTYDASNNLVSSTDPLGQTTTWTYDNRRNLTSVTDPLHDTYRKTYNDRGEVLTATDPSGHVATSIYDARGNLIRFVDASGAVSTSTFDDLGRLTSQTDPVGNKTTLAYGAGPSPTRITNADGTVRTLSYNGNGQLTEQVDENGNRLTFQYDAAGRQTSQVDAQGNTTSYTYDAANQVTSITDPMGLKRRFEYDAAGNIVAETDPSGHRRQAVYDAKGELLRNIDPLGNVSSATYNALGRLTSATDARGGVAHFGYDANGNQTTSTDANGHTTTREYDVNGNVVKLINPLGGIQTFTYDAQNNQTSATDELGRTTTYEYDALNRLIKTTGPAASTSGLSRNLTASFASVRFAPAAAPAPTPAPATPQTTIDTYNAAGLLTSETDPNGHTTTLTYDSRGRVTAITDPLGNSRHYAFDGVGNLISATDELGNVTRYVYDGVKPATVDTLGRNSINSDRPDTRLVEVIDPLGGTVKYEYDADGNVIAATNPLGQKTTFTYDGQGKLLTSTDPRGGVTRYTYDDAGNRTSLTDPGGLKTLYTYDAAGNIIKETDPAGNSIVASYDAAGNETQITDRDGRQRVFTYDAANQLIQEDWMQGGQSIRTIRYAYDAVGNLSSASDPSSTYTLTHDTTGLVTSVYNAGTPGLPHFVISAAYDPAGNLTTVSDNLGVTVTSTYDAANGLSGVAWTGTGVDPVHVSYTRNAVGNVTEIGRFSDASGSQKVGRTTVGFDAVGQVTSITHLDALDAVLASYSSKYDLNGRLTAETINGRLTTYGYDPIGELTSVHSGGLQIEGYTYDANGNRRQAGDSIVNNEVLFDGTYHYTYDAEGNLTTRTSVASGQVTKFTYDYRNRVTAVEIDDRSGVLVHSARYDYDVFDNRIAVTVDGVTSRTLYVGQSAWADLDASGAIKARYLQGESLDQTIARWRPGEGTTWYLTDGLGTVRDLANAAGNLVDHIDYDTFGQIFTESNPASGDRFKYTGREFDFLTGLYYYRARYYAPAQGRFLSQDPLGFQGGDLNLYRYAQASPPNFTDPTGQGGLIQVPVVQVQVAIEAKEFEKPGKAAAHTGFKINDCFQYSFDTYAETASGGDVAARDLAEFGHAAIELKTMASFVTKYITTGDYEQDVHEEIHSPPSKTSKLDAYGTISSIGFGQLGVIYLVPGSFTTSGNDYLGSADDLKSRHQSALDKEKKQGKFRDRSQASIVDCYMIDPGNKAIRNRKEQNAIDNAGGPKGGKTDNRINVIRKKFIGP